MIQEWLECITCHAQYDATEVHYTCSKCQGLLAVERPATWHQGLTTALWDGRLSSRNALDDSGVWRFREAVMNVPAATVVSHPEGRTRLYSRPALSRFANVEALHFKHEGENPTGSFKDRGMTVATTQARRVGARAVACASTGNTSASLAAYAAQAGLTSLVFVPAGKITVSKMAQTVAYGARVVKVRGDFDAAMDLVRKACDALGIYLLNSVNAFRIEGQKTIVWELLQDLQWNAPDWIAVPAGNLGNTSAFGKALKEASDAGWIKKIPRIASIQASNANPFFLSYSGGFATRHKVKAETVASAIRIGDPVSYDKARAAIEFTRGVVAQVSDEELLRAKREIDGAGIGCEPASACSLAGTRILREQGVIKPGESVVCVLTGHVLKDPDVIMQHVAGTDPLESRMVEVDADLASVERALKPWL